MTEQAFDRVAELERLAALPDEEQEEKKDDAPAPKKEEEAPAPKKEEEAPADKEPVDDVEDDGEEDEEEPAVEEKPADKAVSPQHARIKAKQEREQLRREVAELKRQIKVKQEREPLRREVDELRRQLQEKTKEPEVQKQEREVDLSVLDNLDDNTRAALHEITSVYAEDLARLQESVAPVIANKRTQEIMQRIDVDGEAYSKQHSLPADWLINYTMSVYHASNEEQQLLTGKGLDKKAFLDSMVNDVDRLYKAGVNPLAVYHARAKNLNPAFLQQREQVVEQPKLADTAASRAKSSGMVGTGTSPMTSSETKEAKLASDFQKGKISREDYFAGIAALA